MQEDSSAVSFCPSFNSYSSDRIADIAAKVTRELDDEVEAASSESKDSKPAFQQQNDEDDDFEFVSVRADPDASSSFAADGLLLFDGQIRPVFPVFNRQLLLNEGDCESYCGNQDRDRDSQADDVASIRIPLKNLFIEDRDPPSSSSSEADELEGVPEGTYCVWNPKPSIDSSPSPGRCKKSNSTGSSSKRWRLRDLLKRSNSDGKDPFIFLNSNSMKKREDRGEKVEKGEDSKERKSSGEVKVAGKTKAKGVVAAGEKASAHEVFYVRNKALKEGDGKRKSYLPYRQDLVGLFANVNGLGRSFPPF